MLKRALAVTAGLAISAVPGTAQNEHQHDHTQEEEPTATQGTMMQEMMMACPFFETMGMSGEMQGMMNGGMMDHEMMGGMGDDRMGIGMLSPLDLIDMKDQLFLSETQVEDLKGLDSRIRLATHRHLTSAKNQRSVAQATLQENPEGLGDYSEALRVAVGHMLEGHLLLIQARFEAQKVLTPMQKKALSIGPIRMHQPVRMGGAMMGTGKMKATVVSGSGG